jgi:histidine ammonia-lyase
MAGLRMAFELTLLPGHLTLADLRRVVAGDATVRLADDAWPAVDAAAATVQGFAEADDAVYGVNTGFGRLARTRIGRDDLSELQRRLVLSHCTGVGDPLPDPVVRLLLLLKVNSLARGHSGVRRAVIAALLACLNADVLPVIPAKGSVGASGDLPPLAHMAAALLGEGQFRCGGQAITSDQAFARAGVGRLVLGPKEGLAILNGSQASTALAAVGLFAIESAFAAAIAAGALSIDATLGSDTPFDPRIQAVRGHRGQADVAQALARLLEGSAIRHSHEDCDRVQDPYSLRCQPQVMGAALDLIRFAAGTIETEANGVSDNPLVFPGDRAILSGGNFHAEPIAFAADILALAIAEIGALSERRIALLTDPALSSLPAFLIAEPGLNSGFMIAQVTAAALASENKTLAHPASVDSLPTSANQEDHVSMATFAARRLTEMARNTADVVAIELLAAAQGVDMRAPLRTSPALAAIHTAIRARSAFVAGDRALAPDIAAISALIASGWFRAGVPIELPST